MELEDKKMNAKLKYFILILCSACICLFSVINTAQAAATCDNPYQAQTQDDGTTPNASGMFSDEIMKGMQEFMRITYLQLSKVLMIGHSLMCYANKVDYICLGIRAIYCIAEIPNPNLLISGLIIYIVGVLMLMSIGMYFVDISFKLGFAILFMPISIALWPFSPTKNKLNENLSIIIRNGMLFTLVAIGVSFSVTLISSSLVGTEDGRDGWAAFWNAVANQRTETLVENFAVYKMHFLIVIFALMFAFKLLASSVNDYLDYFFSDAVFGSESPMHHMGTQAVGMVAQNAVKPAASFITDVAKTQSGKAIAGLGTGIAMMGSKQGRQQLASNIKSGASKVKNVVGNPRQTYNTAMGAIGAKANSAIQTVGKAAQHTAEGVILAAAPVGAATRQKWAKAVGGAIANEAQIVGGDVEKVIAHGGKHVQNMVADTAAAGANQYNKIMDNNKPFVTGDDVKQTVRNSIDSVKDDVKTVVSTVASEIKNEATTVKNDVQAGLSIIAATKLGQETIDAWKNSDSAPVTLQPSAVISAPFKAIKHPQKTIRNMSAALRKAKQDNPNVKAIAKTGGKIVFRSIKGVGSDAKKVAEGTANIFGNVLKDFGLDMQNNAPKEGDKKFTSWSDMERRRQEKQEFAAEERAYFSSLSDKYDEGQ